MISSFFLGLQNKFITKARLEPLLSLLTVVLYLLCAQSTLSAQSRQIFTGDPDEIPESADSRMTPAERDRLAKRYKIKPESRQMQIMTGQVKPGAPAESIFEKPLMARFIGKEQTKFSTQRAIEQAMAPLLPTKEERLKLIAEKQASLEKQLEKRYSKIKPFPACRQNKTERREIGNSREKSAKDVTMDYLFINKQDLPELADEKIGKNTAFKLVDQNVGTNQAAIGLGIKCLPARYRATNNYIFVDQGLNALKNYDKDFHGNGNLHPSLKGNL